MMKPWGNETQPAPSGKKRCKVETILPENTFAGKKVASL